MIVSIKYMAKETLVPPENMHGSPYNRSFLIKNNHQPCSLLFGGFNYKLSTHSSICVINNMFILSFF